MDNKQNTLVVILDAARIFGEINTAQKLQSKFLSLYSGESEQLLSSVAPYMFNYQEGSEFAGWLHEKGWGKAWGIFVKSDSSLEELRSHLRNFLMITTADGSEFYFRFYDPRVLRNFLPTCNAGQLKEFFGPVVSYLMEDEDPEFALEFSLGESGLMKERIAKKEMFAVAGSDSSDNNKPKIKLTTVDPTMMQKDDKPNPKKGWTFMVD